MNKRDQYAINELIEEALKKTGRSSALNLTRTLLDCDIKCADEIVRKVVKCHESE